MAWYLLLSLLVFWNSGLSLFEQQQAAAQAGSPRGLVVSLATPGHRRIFHVGERILLVTEYSSTVPDGYEVDVADSRNAPPLSDRFFVYPPGRALISVQGAVCCEARRLVLSHKPVVVLSHMELRFSEPGSAVLYMTTQRVFRRHDPNLYTASKLHSASQLLRIEIVPADDTWQQRELPAVERKLKSEPASKFTHWASCRDLAVLDVPEAIALKVAWLRSGGPCSENSMFQSFVRLPEAEAALLRLMKEPDVSITAGMMRSLIEVRLRQSQRWLFALKSESPQDFPENVMSFGYAATEAGAEVVKELTPYLALKTAQARANSEMTLAQFSAPER